MQNGAVLYCHCIGLIPGLFVWLALFAQESLPLALVYFEGICLILLPSLLLAKRQWFLPSQRNFSWYYLRLVGLCSNWREQWQIAILVSSLIILVLVFGWYFIARNNLGMFGVYVPPDVIERMVKTLPLPQAIFGSIWFSLVNPILEELFWRLFLAEELHDPCACCDGARQARDSIQSNLPTENEANIELSITFTSQIQEQPPLASSKSEMSVAHAEAVRWMVSGYYALYHVVVVIRFFPPLFGLSSFIGLTITGRILLIVRDMPKLGMLTSIIAHSGLDAAFAIVAADFVSNDLHKHQDAR